jgi:hypothetical protein
MAEKALEHIVCPVCQSKATRVGAQDACDVYVCDAHHVTRVLINAPRNEWKEPE